MSYDFSDYKSKTEEIVKWLSGELLSVRTGRATPSLLDSIFVESYGTRLPLNQVANIGIEDPKTLRVTPFDQSTLKDIEKAITDANLGVSVVVDATGLRVVFPELTSERKTLLVKLAKDKHEEARVSLRKARDEVWSDIQEKQKNGEITEDEKFAAKEEMEKITKDINEQLDALFKKKEEEINE